MQTVRHLKSFPHALIDEAVARATRLAEEDSRASPAFCAREGVITTFRSQLLDEDGRLRIEAAPLFLRLAGTVENRLGLHRRVG